MNEALKQLGFSPKDRVLIVHADDIGMCQASISAFEHLLDFGLTTSGSVMSPCPWFPMAVKLFSENPSIDVGIHLTLTCEWKTYRWRPLSVLEAGSGLTDKDGYFPFTPQAIWEKVSNESALREAHFQIEKAIAMGLDITHLEDHMGVFSHPRLVEDYFTLLFEYQLPAREQRLSWDVLANKWFQPHFEALQKAIRAGLPVFDFIRGLPLVQPQDQEDFVLSLLKNLPPGGLSMIVFHPSVDTPELRAIASDWPSRVANYQTFLNPKVKEFIRNYGIFLIGYRDLRDLMRGGTLKGLQEV